MILTTRIIMELEMMILKRQNTVLVDLNEGQGGTE